MKLLLVNPSTPRRRFRARKSSVGSWHKPLKGSRGGWKAPTKPKAKARDNPKRKVKRTLSPAQIAAGFGGKRRQKKSSRASIRRAYSRSHALHGKAARRSAGRKRAKTSTRRNPGDKSMRIRRRRRVRLNPRRRSRRLLRLNPSRKRKSKGKRTRRRARRSSSRRRARWNPGKSPKRSKAAKKAARTRKRNAAAKAQRRSKRGRRRARRIKLLSAYQMPRENPSRRSRRRRRRNPGKRRGRRSKMLAVYTGGHGRGAALARAAKKHRRSKSFRTTMTAYKHARRAKALARTPKEQAFLRAAGLAGVPNPGLGAVSGIVKLAPTILGGAGAFGAAAALGTLIAVKAAPSLPAATPALIRNQLPAISAGLLTVAGYALCRNVKPLARASLGVAVGGGIATLILIALGIKVKTKGADGADVEVTLAKRLGLPFGEYTRMGAAGGNVRGIFAGLGEYTHTGGTDDDPQWDDLRGTDDDPQWDDGAGVLEGGIWD